MSETSATTNAAAPGRASDSELNARASLLDRDVDIGFADTFKVLARGFAFVRYFRWRFFTKWVTTLFALLYPVFVLPWGVKIVIDHVVLARPITGTDGYPAWLHPAILFLQGMPAVEILGWLMATAIVLVVLVGAYGPGSANDTTEAGMPEGQDTATRQENLTHGGHSFAGGLWGYFEYKFNSRLTQSVNHLVRVKLFESIRSLPMTTLDNQRIGDSVYRVLYDAPSVNQIFYEIINRPTLSTTTFVAAMYNLHSAYPHMPEVVWMVALLFPMYLLITLPFARMVRRRQQASRAAGTITTSTIEEGMDNIVAVQSLGGEAREQARFGSDSKESFRRFRGTVVAGILVAQAQVLAQTLIVTLVFVFVISNVIDGKLTPGDYGALFFYYGWMRGPAESFSTLWIYLQQFVPGMRRVFALMDLQHEQDVGHQVLGKIEHGIELRGAGLVYPDGRRALTNINLEARIGQIVALVGPTGAGKTSLAYLLPRYHMATEGAVLVDGHNVNDVTADSLRTQITYVFQETQLFSATIADNIRFGNETATDADVERVARIAGAHDFVMALPAGYATKLGASTISGLSVGQKQRISIARGLLRDARILILDEPTSALDPETESYLVRALHAAASDRLVIIIAHRLSTIAHADTIVFLEDGQIREQGSHAELMRREGGYYRHFVEMQTSGSNEGVGKPD